jgi:hypothetical protein
LLIQRTVAGFVSASTASTDLLDRPVVGLAMRGLRLEFGDGRLVAHLGQDGGLQPLHDRIERAVHSGVCMLADPSSLLHRPRGQVTDHHWFKTRHGAPPRLTRGRSP